MAELKKFAESFASKIEDSIEFEIFNQIGLTTF
jgi:hypothetical protein